MPDIIQKIKKIIETIVLVHNQEGLPLISSSGREMAWMFDVRSALLDGEFLNNFAELFWHAYEKQYPFQVGGLETASLPMIAAVVLKGKERGTPINGFYMRKSRKPEGLQKIIEGKLTDDTVILIDDLINNGGTFLRQIETLKRENKKVSDIFALIRFRKVEEYEFAKEEKVRITSPFSLEDFGLSLVSSSLPAYGVFEFQWAKQLAKPNYFLRIPKSAPAIDDKKIYVGADDGYMRALSQSTGEELWNFKIAGFGSQGKTIISSPTLFNRTVYFGAYDGNFYALDAETGKKKWIYMDADWIGSSPCAAEDLGIVYVGLEFGLFNKRGGIVALDAKTGKKKWEYGSMPSLTHGSPAYDKKTKTIIIGSNNGIVYAFDAEDGALRWQFQTGAEVRASFAVDESRGYVVFGSHDNYIYVLDIKDGTEKAKFETGAPLYSTPLVENNKAYMGSLDKKLYCIDLQTLTLVWTRTTNGRIFSSPVIADGHLYVGSNDGRLYEFDPKTGANTAFFQTTERITNKIAYNADTKTLFLPTYANEIYCLKRV